MEAITADQKKAIAAIIHKRGLNADTKMELVLQFSGGRCSSSRDLNITEARALISYLNQSQKGYLDGINMRNRIMYLAFEMGWQIPGKPKPRVDVPRIDKWCIKFGYLHKTLDNYKYEELPKLVSQFEIVYKDFLRRL